MAEEYPYPVPDLMKAAGHLFDAFAREHSLPAEQLWRVSPPKFLEYLHEQIGKLDTDALAAELAVDPGAVHWVLALAESEVGTAQLMTMWPFLTLGKRPCTHEVCSCAVTLAIRWTDGTVVPISMVGHKEVTDRPFNDAAITALVLQRAQDLVQPIVAIGLDALHDGEMAQPGFVQPALLFKLMRLAGDPAVLPDAQDRVNAQRLIKWVGGLFPTTLDPELKRRLGVPAPTHPTGGFAT